MHSSGMRTARFSGFRGEGIFVPFTETPWTETSPEGTWDQVQRPHRQKPAQGTCDQAQRPLPVYKQIPVKILPCTKLRVRAEII